MSSDQTFASIDLPASQFPPNDLRGVDKNLENIYAIFGNDAMLIPVSPEQAKNMSIPCVGLTHQQTREVHHQVRLTRECIAVACVRGSLRAIFFAKPDAQLTFLTANPSLQSSLITQGPQGSVLWFRSATAPDGAIVVAGAPLCWIGSGAAVVVAGRGRFEQFFKILNLAKPVEIIFDQIVWPESFRIELILRRLCEYDEPFTKDPRRRIIPNWNYWSRCLAAIAHINYDLKRESFYQAVPDQDIRLLPNERVLYLISDLLSIFGRQDRFSILLNYRESRFLKEMLSILKIVTAQSPNPEDDLEKFLISSLEPCQGQDVSSAELNAQHAKYFHAKKLPPYPASVFEKRVPAYIEQLFHGVRSRKIRRGGKYCRGYSHVRIKR